MYRGATLPVVLDGVFFSILFTNVNFIKFKLNDLKYSHYSETYKSFIAGSVAGVIQAPITTVFELIKLRIQNMRTR